MGRLESFMCKCVLNDMEIWVVFFCIIEIVVWVSVLLNKGSILFGFVRSFWLILMLELNSFNMLIIM